MRSRAAARLSLSEGAAEPLLLFSSVDFDAAGSDDSTGLGLLAGLVPFICHHISILVSVIIIFLLLGHSYFEMMGGVVMEPRPKKNGWRDQGLQPPNPLI